jgi:lipoic acid synthetase
MDIQRKPDWLKVPIPSGDNYNNLIKLIKENNIHTICQEAKCPNIAECFAKKTATFLILGDKCTRDCCYCNVEHGIPEEKLGKVDGREPKKVAEAVETLGLKYVVITSVTRDDLQDGGARTFVDVMKEIRKVSPNIKIELLTPDFREQIKKILAEKPNVFGHNIETVERLFPEIRPRANYRKSILFLKQIKEYNPSQLTKSGFMLGLGETKEEIIGTMKDLKAAKVDIITIGQYLQPRADLAEVKKFYTPEEFSEFEQIGRELGFKSVFSAPLVRSSYHAESIF